MDEGRAVQYLSRTFAFRRGMNAGWNRAQQNCSRKQCANMKCGHRLEEQGHAPCNDKGAAALVAAREGL
jgi:hypothetical protein